jgi:outer membrane receptor for monomeric catechols
MAGITLFALKLSSVVTAKAIALGLPYVLDKDPPRPSRVEQRHIDVAQAVPPMPVAKLAAVQKPAVPSAVLASQLDLAETNGSEAKVATVDDAASLRAGGAKKYRSRRLAYRAATRPAADAFNRSFGVIPIASN